MDIVANVGPEVRTERITNILMKEAI